MFKYREPVPYDQYNLAKRQAKQYNDPSLLVDEKDLPTVLMDCNAGVETALLSVIRRNPPDSMTGYRIPGPDLFLAWQMYCPHVPLEELDEKAGDVCIALQNAHNESGENRTSNSGYTPPVVEKKITGGQIKKLSKNNGILKSRG